MKRLNSILIIFFLVISLLFGFYFVKAAQPTSTPTTTLMTLIKCEKYGGGVGGCLQAIYNLGVQVAVALAFLMIIIGGIEYMLSTTVPGKLRGKQRIVDAIIGLSIIFLSGTVLYWINPRIFQAILVLPVIKISPKMEEAVSEIPPSQIPVGLTYQGSTQAQRDRYASSELKNLLDCMERELKNINKGAIVTAIVDNYTLQYPEKCFNTSTFDYSNCKHNINSCHYGGAKRCKESGKNASYAVDLYGPSSDLINIAQRCGGKPINEVSHIHVYSSQNKKDECDCY
jgi:hypothetical protein